MLRCLQKSDGEGKLAATKLFVRTRQFCNVQDNIFFFLQVLSAYDEIELLAVKICYKPTLLSQNDVKAKSRCANISIVLK